MCKSKGEAVQGAATFMKDIAIKCSDVPVRHIKLSEKKHTRGAAVRPGQLSDFEASDPKIHPPTVRFR